MTRALLLLAMGLVACSKTAVGPEDHGPLKGWRSAGLVSPSEGKDSSRFEWMRVSGKDLFVANLRGEIFHSRQGELGWTRLELPDGGTVSTFQTTDSSLLVGTSTTGKLWMYRPSIEKWDSLPLQISRPSTIYSIGIFQSSIAIYASWQDSNQSIQLLDGTGQRAWATGYPNRLSTAHTLLEWNGTLWAATFENGLWKRSLGDSVWSETVRPLDEELQIRDKMPRGMAVYRDSLWVGYNAGPIFQTKDGREWSAKRNCMVINTCLDAPYSAFALLSYRGRLFAAGYAHASPMEWDPDSAKWVPILNETWCREVNGSMVCGGSYNLDMAAIGDTLYACGNARIMKMPLSDLPPRGRWTP